MENSIFGQCSDASVTYDYRMYDRIWQRVSPDLNPYPEVRAATDGMSATAASTTAAAPAAYTPAAFAAPAASAAPAAASAATGTADSAAPAAASTAPASTAPVPVSDHTAESELPGAEIDPCCMGTEAQESLGVLAGFIEEELAERRCCLTLCRSVRSTAATRLLRRIAAEKQCAAREMCTAYFLITGGCYTPAVTVEHMQWDSLAAALRSCYHQEACNGFNYQRAADETLDICLQKMFARLSQQSYKRADDVMALLCQILCQS